MGLRQALSFMYLEKSYEKGGRGRGRNLHQIASTDLNQLLGRDRCKNVGAQTAHPLGETDAQTPSTSRQTARKTEAQVSQHDLLAPSSAAKRLSKASIAGQLGATEALKPTR